MATCLVCGNEYEGLTNCPADGSVLLEGAVRVMTQRAGHVIDGRYRIHEKLADNALGELFEARHVARNKPVALQLLRKELGADKDALQRFQRAAKAASGVQHPNVVRILGLGRAEDKAMYVATEWLQDETLRARLERGPMPASLALAIANGVAAGLSAAHDGGVAHRALQPEHIVLTGESDSPMPKISSFAYAHLIEEMTPEAICYLAPEQVRGEGSDGRTDIYTMGIILYEMVTGMVPFSADEPSAVLRMHLEEAHEPPSRRAPGLGIPTVVDELVGKCLQKAVADRYQTAQQLQVAIEATIALAEAEAKAARTVQPTATPEPVARPNAPAAPPVAPARAPAPPAPPIAAPPIAAPPESVVQTQAPAPVPTAAPAPTLPPVVVPPPVATPMPVATPEPLLAPTPTQTPMFASEPVEDMPPLIVQPGPPPPNRQALIIAVIALLLAVIAVLYVILAK